MDCTSRWSNTVRRSKMLCTRCVRMRRRSRRRRRKPHEHDVSRHALIIGGSLGGLLAAHMLRAAGWRVDVVERSTDDLAGRGAGLGTHDGLVAVLRRIGISIDDSLGVATHSYIWLDTSGAT